MSTNLYSICNSNFRETEVSRCENNNTIDFYAFNALKHLFTVIIDLEIQDPQAT